jgi:rare lipoprotein A
MRRAPLLLAPALVAAVLFSGCASSRSRTGGVPIERGIASWYGPGFHGKFTASGERYDMKELTAAHRTLPFGTLVEVRNLENGKSVVVRINDRGPFAKNRVIDLSRAAARAIDMIGPGTAEVELLTVGRADVSPGAYAVQVGAFRDEERAQQLAADLCDRYPEVQVRSDRVWHRVQVGAFPDRHQAERFAEQLAAAGYAAVVVPLSRLEAGAR